MNDHMMHVVLLVYVHCVNCICVPINYKKFLAAHFMLTVCDNVSLVRSHARFSPILLDDVCCGCVVC